MDNPTPSILKTGGTTSLGFTLLATRNGAKPILVDDDEVAIVKMESKADGDRAEFMFQDGETYDPKSVAESLRKLADWIDSFPANTWFMIDD